MELVLPLCATENGFHQVAQNSIGAAAACYRGSLLTPPEYDRNLNPVFFTIHTSHVILPTSHTITRHN
jgi:hypothetical protein